MIVLKILGALLLILIVLGLIIFFYAIKTAPLIPDEDEEVSVLE